MPRPAILAAALVALLAIGYCLSVIVPLGWGALLFATTVWFSVPGVAAAWLMYAPGAGRGVAAWIVGPIWGYGASSLVLLVLWTSGVRGNLLFAAPIAAFAIAAAAGYALNGVLTPPPFTNADVVAILLLLVMVPAIVGRPFAHVAEPVDGGRAYRAYFTADMIWRMAVVAEVSKGSIPPRNPFLRGQPLNYYWLPHLLPAAQYRILGRSVSLEQVLLVNSIVLGLAFVVFLYGFVRQWVASRVAAALGTIAAFVFTSFEGTERLWVLWRQGESIQAALASLRDVNIDAVTRWFYNSLPIDGLQRLLWYQPHHSTGYALGLSCLLILAQARGAIAPRMLAFCGLLLGAALLFSTFAAIMLTMMVALTAAFVLVRARQWTTVAIGAVAGALPLAIAVWIAMRLRYVDLSGPSLARVLVNPMAITNIWASMILNFGPMLILGTAGAVFALRQRTAQFFGIAAIVLVSIAFYFFVDVRDHQYVYVGWRSGHFLFVALAVLTAFGLQELWRLGRAARMATACVTIGLALMAVPTFAIDFYNTQDVTNYKPNDKYSWTLLQSADEIAAWTWIRTWTPPGAIVQIEPHAREGRRWADVPAFAERRMAAGLPISMVPLQRYEDASRKIETLYNERDPEAVFREAARLGIDYLIVGPPERASFPEFEATLRSRPSRFRETFHSGDVSIFMLEGGS
ncbi:MAG TPA: hypothetical protein VH740_27235 [Vicinamibacterales bacterium]